MANGRPTISITFSVNRPMMLLVVKIKTICKSDLYWYGYYDTEAGRHIIICIE